MFFVIVDFFIGDLLLDQMIRYNDNENLMKFIVENGGEISNSISSKTFALISKDPSKLSGKSKKAVSLGVPVYSIEVFKNMYI